MEITGANAAEARGALFSKLQASLNESKKPNQPPRIHDDPSVRRLERYKSGGRNQAVGLRLTKTEAHA